MLTHRSEAASSSRVLLSEVKFALLLLVGIILFRGRSLFTPYADPTSGLYLHIGNAWLHGHLPYTTTWDYRPPGYFALYALAIKLVGSYFARDTLAVLSLWATAIAVGKIVNKLDKKRRWRAGYWAAGFFVLLSPVNDGIAGVAELQISALIAWAIYCSLTRPSSFWGTVFCGLLAGLAIQCKLSAIPLAVIPFLVIATRTTKHLNAFSGFSIGFAAPIIAIISLYARSSELGILWNANIESTLRRAAHSSSGDEFARNRINFGRQFFALAPIIEFACFGTRLSANASLLASVGWVLAAILSIIAAGEFFERQFVLLTAPIAILGTIGFLDLLEKLTSRRAIYGVAALSILVTFALHDYFETNQTLAYALHRVVLRDATWRLDQSAELNQALSCLPKQSNELYLVEQNPYLYDLLGQRSPTVYAYSDHLLDPRLSEMAGIDGRAELNRVIQANPSYIVVSSLKDFRYSLAQVKLLNNALATRYNLDYRTSRFRVYRSRFLYGLAASLPCVSRKT